ncbi:hypothetical protein B0T21DRAFT_136196 [Apiosordaria backusii]|uniref:Ubiquitin-like protease family profile domain-containing protein n=1 Tax=Apiosordaria backusii TaxID=314023 RepID=A0AA40BRG6_9PEZI|nr:hypothetical protein B0T21DRAFT_136196 [Apiosordaria backusii]
MQRDDESDTSKGSYQRAAKLKASEQGPAPGNVLDIAMTLPTPPLTKKRQTVGKPDFESPANACKRLKLHEDTKQLAEPERQRQHPLQIRDACLSDTEMYSVLWSLVVLRRNSCTLDPLFIRRPGRTESRKAPVHVAHELSNPEAQILLPLHLVNHWALLHIDVKRRIGKIYDSLPSDANREMSRAIAHQFVEDYLSQQGEWIWKDEECPRQNDGRNCGVFALVTAAFLTAGQPLPSSYDPWFCRRILTLFEPEAHRNDNTLVVGTSFLDETCRLPLPALPHKPEDLRRATDLDTKTTLLNELTRIAGDANDKSQRLHRTVKLLRGLRHKYEQSYMIQRRLLRICRRQQTYYRTLAQHHQNVQHSLHIASEGRLTNEQNSHYKGMQETAAELAAEIKYRQRNYDLGEAVKDRLGETLHLLESVHEAWTDRVDECDDLLMIWKTGADFRLDNTAQSLQVGHGSSSALLLQLDLFSKNPRTPRYHHKFNDRGTVQINIFLPALATLPLMIFTNGKLTVATVNGHSPPTRWHRQENATANTQGSYAGILRLKS